MEKGHTECTWLWQMAQTIPLDVYHMLRLHAEQIDVAKTERQGDLQTKTEVAVPLWL